MYIYLNEGTNLYITCGQKGWTHYFSGYPNIGQNLEDNPTYNGGARASNSHGDSGVGGGATSIAISNHGELKDFANCKNDVLMVAGGGAGGSSQSSGSGGLVLYAGSGTNYSVINGADISLLNGQFALGSPPVNDADGGGGGGGWIGGKSGLDVAGNSAGGGASFVNTSQRCIPIELVPDYNTKDGYVHITSTDYTEYYAISYDYDGGVAENPISYSVTQDDFTLAKPTKEGYTFTGWTGSNGDTPQKDVTIKKGTAKNLSFKANWTINYYTLDLNSEVDGECLTRLPDGCTCDLYINGQLEESGIVDVWKQYPYGTMYEFKNFKTGVNLVYANKVQSTYHDSEGCLDENCQPLKGIVKAYMNSSKYGGLTHVVPVFNTKSVNVTFHCNTSSSDTQTASQTFIYGVANQKFNANTFKRDGYKFMGWAFNKNATKIDYPDLCNVVDSWIDLRYPKVDLYAVWSTNQYTITYDVNGGLLSGQKTSYNIETADFTLPTPSKFGYVFAGWTGSNGTTAQKSVTIAKGSIGDKSYTANWIQINTINYNAETVYPSWALAKNYLGGSVNITSEVVNGNNVPVGATAIVADSFLFDGWYSSSGELITKNATVKPLNCNAERRGGFIYPSYGGSGVYDASTDTYTITTDVRPEEGTAKEVWGSGVYHYSSIEIPWNNWYIAEFEVCSPIDAKCVIDINNWGPSGAYWNGNDNDNVSTRFYSQNGTNPEFMLKANTWRKIVIWYQNSDSKNTKHVSLWDQHTINLKYDKSFGNQTFKIRNYKSAVSPILVKELDTFTARFKPWEHTVVYDANGGTGAPESFKKCTWTGRKLSSTIPTRTGYTFKNWNTKKDGTGTTYNPEQQYVPDQNGGTVTLYAQWTANVYTNMIKHWLWGFNGEGNNSWNGNTAFNIADSTFSAAYKSTFIMDSQKSVMIPNGCYFGNTFLEKTSGSWEKGTYVGYTIDQSLMQKATQMDFQYNYYPYDYSITYNLNGGTNNNANPSTYTVLYGVTLKNPIRAGYIFTGWYDENGHKVTGINEGCNATFSSSDDLYAKLATRTTGNKTLTARWEPIHYTVKYDANGGTGTMASQDIIYTDIYDNMTNTTKCQYTKNGYLFDGWYASRMYNGKLQYLYASSSSGRGEWYDEGHQPSGYSLYKYSNGEKTGHVTTVDKDVITFHAQWQINTYDLSVKHTVSGNMGNKCSDFSFMLNLSGMSGNNITAVFTDASGKQTTKILAMNNGKVAFMLKHGETVVFKNVPYNTSYTITEDNVRDYIVSSSNASGKVTDNTAATFTSVRNMMVPTSADTNIIAMISIVCVAGVAILLIVKKRRKTK